MDTAPENPWQQTAYDPDATDLQRGVALREWARVYLEAGSLTLATRKIEAALAVLRNTSEREDDEKEAHRAAYFTALSYLGRVFLRSGDSERARNYLQLADGQLHLTGDKRAELENLAWRMEAETFFHRFHLAPRTVELAARLGYCKPGLRTRIRSWRRPLGLLPTGR